MNTEERTVIERTVVSCCLDRIDCLEVSIATLPLDPFRNAVDGPELGHLHGWLVRLADAGIYDGIQNRSRILDAMRLKAWPAGWLDAEREGWLEYTLAWTALSYDVETMRALCGALRDEDDAADRLVDVRWAYQSDLRVAAALSFARSDERPRSVAPRVLEPAAGADSFLLSRFAS